MFRFFVLLLVAALAQQPVLAEGVLIEDLYDIPDSNSNVDGTSSVYFESVAALDLDQRTIVARLASESIDGLAAAEKVFEMGAFSDTFAVLTITDGGFSNLSVPAGTPVVGTTASGATIRGIANFGSDFGNSTLEVHYVSASESSSNVCSVGGNPQPITTGCKFLGNHDSLVSIFKLCVRLRNGKALLLFHFFLIAKYVRTYSFLVFDPGDKWHGLGFAPSGTISLDGEIYRGSYGYSYNPLENNYNGLSLSTLDRFRDSTTPQRTFNKFFKYYRNADYDKEWIHSAFTGASTSGFENGVMDFQNFGLEGRGAAIRWGVVVLRVWMFVVNGLEAAVSKCGTGQISVDRWDQAVAAYSGSVPIATGGDGYFLFTLAQTECRNFGTCDKGSGLAPINEKIYENFRQGKGNLLQGDCTSADANAKRISELMTIPLIQGIMRSAHALDLRDNSQETIQGQAAAYAAAILPLMNDCSMGNAFVVYDDLAPGRATGGSFEVIKAALERAYDCLGVTCDDVGGLLNLKGDGYEIGAEPCGYNTGSIANTPTQAFAPTRQPTPQPIPQPNPTSFPVPVNKGNNMSGSNPSTRSNALVMGLSIGAGIVAALIAIIVGISDHKRSKQFDTAEGTTDTGAVEIAAKNAGNGEAAVVTSGTQIV